MAERRVNPERRTRVLIPESLERRGERRQGVSQERRDSPRRGIALDVREPGGTSRSCQGDLSVSGASFVTTAPPAGELVQLMFSLPTYAGPIVASACVVSRCGALLGTQVGVAFTDIDVEAQLAIAQWVDDGRGDEPIFAAATT
jgi:PilZ domain